MNNGPPIYINSKGVPRLERHKVVRLSCFYVQRRVYPHIRGDIEVMKQRLDGARVLSPSS